MKILASDYDGTLSFGGIDDSKRDAIVRWRKAGNLFGPVSGRGLKNLIDMFAENNIECDFILANNGAVIARSDGKVLDEVRCSDAPLKEIVEVLFANRCLLAYVHTAFPCVVKPCAEECEEGEYTLATMPDVPYFTQISTLFSSAEEALEMTEKLKEMFGDVINPLKNSVCIDITSPGVNKASGLYRLLEILGAKHEELIVVGDNLNDATMIAEFRSYAMENGAEEIKALANELTVGVDELILRELSVEG